LLTATLRFTVLTTVAQLAILVTGARAPIAARLERLSFGVTQAISFGVLYWAESRIPSALAGVLTATNPLIVALFAHQFVVGEHLSLSRIAAIGLGFIGTSLIVASTGHTSGYYELSAVAAILIGEVAAAANKIMAKRMTTDVPAPILLRDMGLVVTTLVGLTSFCCERDLPVNFTPASVTAIIYLGLVGSFAASGLYLVLLRRFTVTAMSYVQFAVAAVAAVVGVCVGKEHMGTPVFAGILILLAGLLILAIFRMKSEFQPAANDNPVTT
jgi:drug/metabolite transporter (DMT)-like permease